MSFAAQKINSLTGIRAFAALWVVLLHFRANEGISGVINLDWLASRGFWGVDIFFVLSGFILTYTYYRTFNSPEFDLRMFARFLTKRLARIYPLHFVTFLIFTILALVSFYGNKEIVNLERCEWDTVIPNLLLLHAWGITDALSWNYPSWSISAEWFAYLALMPLGVGLLWKLDIKHSFRVVVFSWLALCLWSGLQGFGVDHYVTNGVLRIIPEFLAGCLLYRIAKLNFARGRSELLFVGGGVGLLLLSQLSRNFEFLLLPCIGALILGLYYQSKVGELLCGNRTVVFLGEISYSIYLTHPLAQMLGDETFSTLQLPTNALTAYLTLSVELILVVLFGALGYYLVERPFRSIIVRYFETRSQQVQPRRFTSNKPV